ncbi:hypothetical protein HYY71_04120 [Candidatus Woesearchaeota archaeon]|nr:hypothetical protein [Candidatus Woesearchaeota archaeon]
MVTQLTVVADREYFNLESLIRHSGELMVGGVIVPFEEMDLEIVQLIDRIGGMRSDGVGIPFIVEGQKWLEQFPEVAERNLHFYGPDVDVRYLHAPYLKGMTDERRREYSAFLLEMLKWTSPDLIFLSNFKAILDKIVPESFPHRIINVHPSVLPENKGWRTEKMALDGINPHASGYTFHVVVPEIDEGPTLFQQKVSPEGHKEESLRLAIIWAQSFYAPKVLSLYASNAKRVIVQSRNAFATEGRESAFNGSDEHQKYRRMIFEWNGSYRTMEEILGAPEYAPPKKFDIMANYRFWLDGIGNDAFIRFSKIITEAQEMGALLKSRSFPNSTRGQLDCRLRVTRDISELLGQIGAQDVEVTYLPVAANAPRMQVW